MSWRKRSNSISSTELNHLHSPTTLWLMHFSPVGLSVAGAPLCSSRLQTLRLPHVIVMTLWLACVFAESDDSDRRTCPWDRCLHLDEAPSQPNWFPSFSRVQPCSAWRSRSLSLSLSLPASFCRLFLPPPSRRRAATGCLPFLS